MENEVRENNQSLTSDSPNSTVREFESHPLHHKRMVRNWKLLKSHRW